jgi:hypothetical protein
MIGGSLSAQQAASIPAAPTLYFATALSISFPNLLTRTYGRHLALRQAVKRQTVPTSTNFCTFLEICCETLAAFDSKGDTFRDCFRRVIAWVQSATTGACSEIT